MSQIALPFEEMDGTPVPTRAVHLCQEKVITKGVTKTSEEKKVTSLAIDPVGFAPKNKHIPRLSQDSSPPLRWPAGLTWEEALAYTSASPAQLQRWQKTGAIVFRRIGRNGAKVALRSQLDLLLQGLFEPAPAEILEDFDFG